MATERFIRGDEVRGFGYPISKGKEGYFPRRNSAAIRRTSIINILCTIPGERVGEEEFGSRLFMMIYEPNDQILAQAIIEETKDAIERWDPNVEVRGVMPEIDNKEVRIYIDFVDRLGKQPDEERLVVSLRRS